jgi:hypothetical protein
MASTSRIWTKASRLYTGNLWLLKSFHNKADSITRLRSMHAVISGWRHAYSINLSPSHIVKIP